MRATYTGDFAHNVRTIKKNSKNYLEAELAKHPISTRANDIVKKVWVDTHQKHMVLSAPATVTQHYKPIPDLTHSTQFDGNAGTTHIRVLPKDKATAEFLADKLWQDVFDSLADKTDHQEFFRLYSQSLKNLAVMTDNPHLYNTDAAQKCAQLETLFDTAAQMDHNVTALKASFSDVTKQKPIETKEVNTAIAAATEHQKLVLNQFKQHIETANQKLATLQTLVKELQNNNLAEAQKTKILRAATALATEIEAYRHFVQGESVRAILRETLSKQAQSDVINDYDDIRKACDSCIRLINDGKIFSSSIPSKIADEASEQYHPKEGLNDSDFNKEELDTIYPLTYVEWDQQKDKKVTKFVTDDDGKVIRMPLRDLLLAKQMANQELNMGDPNAKGTYVTKSFFGKPSFTSYNREEMQKFHRQVKEVHKANQADMKAKAAQTSSVTHANLPTSGVTQSNLPSTASPAVTQASMPPGSSGQSSSSTQQQSTITPAQATGMSPSTTAAHGYIQQALSNGLPQNYQAHGFARYFEDIVKKHENATNTTELRDMLQATLGKFTRDQVASPSPYKNEAVAALKTELAKLDTKITAQQPSPSV